MSILKELRGPMEIKDTRISFVVYPSEAARWKKFCAKYGISMNRALSMGIEMLIEAVEKEEQSIITGITGDDVPVNVPHRKIV